MHQRPDFSVLLPSYAEDDPAELRTAIESVLNQTVSPDEVLIVADGPLPEGLEATVKSFENQYPSVVTVLRIPEHRGLGNALRTGVEAASHDLIARMDADDISAPTRFERQLDYLAEHPETDVVGGYISEFDTDPDDPLRRREVPMSHLKIVEMARCRSPMNHVTVLFDRTAVLAADNYRSIDPMTDYDLWVRMILNGATFANIPEVLVNVRAGEGLYRRRSGVAYARQEVRTQVAFYRRGFISLPRLVFNTVARVGLRLVPYGVHRQVYRHLAREFQDP